MSSWVLGVPAAGHRGMGGIEGKQEEQEGFSLCAEAECKQQGLFFPRSGGCLLGCA